jgi:hypothetical protein
MNLLRRLFLKLLPLAVLVGGGALLISSSGTVTNELFGTINPISGPANAYVAGNFNTLLASQTSAKAGYVREILDWSQIEPSQGLYNWSSSTPYASLFSSEKQSGFKVVAVLTGGPTYLSSGSSDDFLVRWANFVQSAVDNLGDQVDVWEIGSQLNTSTGMSAYLAPTTPTSSTTPDPALYAKMLKVANTIIKTADPNDEVWMGSLVSSTSGSCTFNPLTFLLEVNGSGGFNSMDSITYMPQRGALSPETATTTVSSQCSSSLPANGASLSSEVQSMQDLARQLGGKPLRIEGLGWSADELANLAANRAVTSDQLLADELTRATVILAANNSINDFFWNVDEANNPSAYTALRNLNSVLVGAKLVSQPQGQTGSVYEYRFTKGSQWIIIAWRAQEGDSPIPVTLSDLEVSSLTAYAVDAAEFIPADGTALNVDSNKSTILYLNERPVVFLGKTADLTNAIQEDGQAQADTWKYDIKVMAHKTVNNAKAAALNALKGLLNSAKAEAINWGKAELNKLLN